MKSGKFLYRQEASKQRSIASISKLATTLVFLESQPDLSDVITYSSDSDREGATVDLASGDQLTLEQVLMSTLIPSANNMAVTLSVNAGMDSAAFVSQMNAKVQAIGLKKTSFAEPTGLNPENVSTAGNIAKLARYAFKEFGDVYESAEASSTYTFSLANSDRTITVYSTNKFNGRGLYEAVAFKTGYLPGTADRTLVMEIREIATGHEIVVSLLGNPQYNTIFDEAYSLAYWTFHNWDFQNYD
jgi:D-alanyl-D-alanine endopeptidase (penicillin-binding protein 7)